MILDTFHVDDLPHRTTEQSQRRRVSDYGNRIPTEHQVQLPGSAKWQRIYYFCWSNIGIYYVEADSRDPNSGRPNWYVIRF